MSLLPPPDTGVRISGSLVTAIMALLAFTVQWGMVTTKLDHLDTRINELILETRTARQADLDFESRLSHVEGLLRVGAKSQ